MNTQRIEELIQKVRSIPDSGARDTALELVQAIMELHCTALERAMEIVDDNPAGEQIMDAFCGDEVVNAILLLHDLHPLDLEQRVRKALDDPAFHARGARVDLLSIRDGAIRVRVVGGPALQTAVEKALAEAAPDAAEVIFEGTGGFVPLEQLVAG